MCFITAYKGYQYLLNKGAIRKKISDCLRLQPKQQ